jgi:hypothetical protein
MSHRQLYHSCCFCPFILYLKFGKKKKQKPKDKKLKEQLIILIKINISKKLYILWNMNYLSVPYFKLKTRL